MFPAGCFQISLQNFKVRSPPWFGSERVFQCAWIGGSSENCIWKILNCKSMSWVEAQPRFFIWDLHGFQTSHQSLKRCIFIWNYFFFTVKFSLYFGNCIIYFSFISWKKIEAFANKRCQVPSCPFSGGQENINHAVKPGCIRSL